MESYIRISTLNDFVFCPKSIYFHELYDRYDEKVFQDKVQQDGKLAHETIDEKRYSTAKKYIQSMSIYSDKYQLCGKIDIYNTETKNLVERKNKVEKIYDWYKYQLYAQYYCMLEMWYDVQNLTIYSVKDNISHHIPLPDATEQVKFERLIQNYKHFKPNRESFTQNPNKCAKCIYRELCDYYLRTHKCSPPPTF